MVPASFVAIRCPSLKYAGHVMTAFFNFFSKVRLSDRLHLSQDHGRDFFGGVLLHVPFEIDLHFAISTFLVFNHFVRQKLHISLHLQVIELLPNQPLNSKYCVLRICRLCSPGPITDQALFFTKANNRGRDSVTHFVGDDLDPTILPSPDGGVRCSEINTDDRLILR
mmetsp:Transcript_153413/g.268236  ORF Transcript_153413/g.268236 Transcript_153413/m.268236 type:complete len:167 (-) Transcript_153413:88-588(-)